MVSNITPGASGAVALGVDPRFSRVTNGLSPQTGDGRAAAGDSVHLSDAAAWRAARESVREGVDQLRAALDVGVQAQGLLNKMQDAVSASASNEADFQALLDKLRAVVDEAIEAGAHLLAGEDIIVQAEPSAAPVSVTGTDLRLKDRAQSGDVLSITTNSSLGDGETLMQALQRSSNALRAGLERFTDALRALETHQSVLNSAASALDAPQDLDADSARLLALQVRQGLDSVGGAAIANVEPQAVLSLFRA